MTAKNSNAVSKEELRALLRQEEQKSERYANYARLLLTVLYFGVAFGIRNELPAHSLQAIVVAALFNLVYGLLILKALQGPEHPNWVKYPSISIDILLLSIVIYSFGTFRTFKTEAFLLYFLWIGLSTLRFTPWLTLAAGLLSLFSYGLIVFLAINRGTIELGTISDEFVSPHVSQANIALRMLFLSAFIALSVYIAYVFRLIASKAMRKKILQVRTQEMSNTLDQLREAQKALAQKNRELATLSEIDGLTQLYNRRKLDQIMTDTLQQQSQSESSLALIMLDIDHFKSFNDRFGHQLGDQIIRTLAELLGNSARGNDFIGRWDGEEFLILCRDTDLDTARQISERLRMTIESRSFGEVGPVTCSFGVTEYRPGDNGDSLLRRADEALYQAKAEGRNRVCHN
ncbi:MAG: GGDEF domain-containing protein [Candidatus Thiodiazotropha sp.]